MGNMSIEIPFFNVRIMHACPEKKKKCFSDSLV